MATSNSVNYRTTRDDIIKRALRIIGALGQGETPLAAAVTEAAQALNDILKEWQSDGYHLWKNASLVLTPTAGVNYVTTGTSSSGALLKLMSAYRRTGSGTTLLDVPLKLYTYEEWNNIPNKLQTGTPNGVFYYQQNVSGSPTPPGETNYIYFWPTPDSNFVTTNSGKILVYVSMPLHDFDASGDNPDIPDYLYNALVWALADQLQYEYGVPIADRAQITKKAQTHKALALSYNQEEGSLFLRPAPNWGDQ